MLPTLKQQILGEAKNILKKPFAGASLLANSLVGQIDQVQDGVKQERQ